MVKRSVIAGLIVAVSLWTLGMAASAAAESVGARLTAFEEVPSIVSGAIGFFLGEIAGGDGAINYTLVYGGLEGGAVSAAHIHVGQTGVSGGVSAFLCGGGGKPACPASGAVTGTITAPDVTGPTGQGVAPSELADLLRAIRAGAAYVNVHTATYPTGEIRGQLR